MILVDTNLLGRMTDSSDPLCASARASVQCLWSRNEGLAIVPQVLFEFWAVATRSVGPPPTGQNGLGMGCDRAGNWLRFFRRRFSFLPDRIEMFERWQMLVQLHAITGFKSLDARLVAAMHTYGISRILTFNDRDFKRLGVSVIDPTSVL